MYVIDILNNAINRTPKHKTHARNGNIVLNRFIITSFNVFINCNNTKISNSHSRAHKPSSIRMLAFNRIFAISYLIQIGHESETMNSPIISNVYT